MPVRDRKAAVILFFSLLVIIATVFVLSAVKTDRYNKVLHQDTYSGPDLFRVNDDNDKELSVRVEPISSTWTKLFDLYDEGITEPNYQAYTPDRRYLP